MFHARSYTQETLGPCAICWQEVRHNDSFTWNAARRTWQHTRCLRAQERRAVALAA